MHRQSVNHRMANRKGIVAILFATTSGGGRQALFRSTSATLSITRGRDTWSLVMTDKNRTGAHTDFVIGSLLYGMQYKVVKEQKQKVHR